MPAHLRWRKWNKQNMYKVALRRVWVTIAALKNQYVDIWDIS